MVALNVLVLTAALSASGDTVLLEFSADWCGQCRLMEPTVQRLEDAGFPVRRVDVGREPELARRFQAEGLPCFVLVHRNREVDRVVGAASYDRLAEMFSSLSDSKGSTAAASPPAAIRESRVAVRGQSPDDMAGGGAMFDAVPEEAESFGRAEAPTAGAESTGPINAVEAAALAASVRIKVNDQQGVSYGSGTIIDAHGAEALVVTCGHLFRDSQGKGEIQVEMLAPGAIAPVRGQLIAYDADHRDIALVAIRPEVPFQPARVAGDVQVARAGIPVFTIGCDHGGPSHIIRSHVTAVDKYTNAPNIEVAGQPVDGRSGGGLFTQDGQLIGICNAADPADDEGIYASLPSIHWQLDQIGLSRVYQQGPDMLAANDAVVQPESRSGSEQVSEAPAASPADPLDGVAIAGDPSAGRRRLSADQLFENSAAAPDDSSGVTLATGQGNATANLLAAIDAGHEVICIVRTPNQKDGRVLILDHTSRDLLARLARENEASSPRPTSFQPPVAPKTVLRRIPSAP